MPRVPSDWACASSSTQAALLATARRSCRSSRRKGSPLFFPPRPIRPRSDPSRARIGTTSLKPLSTSQWRSFSGSRPTGERGSSRSVDRGSLAFAMSRARGEEPSSRCVRRRGSASIPERGSTTSRAIPSRWKRQVDLPGEEAGQARRVARGADALHQERQDLPCVVLLPEEAAVDGIEQRTAVVQRRSAHEGGGQQEQQAAAGEELDEPPLAVLVEIDGHGEQRSRRQGDRRSARQRVLHGPPGEELDVEHPVHEHGVGGAERHREGAEPEDQEGALAEPRMILDVGPVGEDEKLREDVEQHGAEPDGEPQEEDAHAAVFVVFERAPFPDQIGDGGRDQQHEHAVIDAHAAHRDQLRQDAAHRRGEERTGGQILDQVQPEEDETGGGAGQDQPVDPALRREAGRSRELADEAPQEERHQAVELQGVGDMEQTAGGPSEQHRREAQGMIAPGGDPHQEEAPEGDGARVPPASEEEERRRDAELADEDQIQNIGERGIPPRGGIPGQEKRDQSRGQLEQGQGRNQSRPEERPHDGSAV